ncbi:MAG: hypothetical protein LBT94_04875 [Prevotellaceae bacterium]|jgi:hypothetical protein|nr:hypothetical protein [Prevotellaceae bacterium]
MKKLSIALLLLGSLTLHAQEQKWRYEYPFIIVDAPAKLRTMRQSNENFLSAYRIGARTLGEALPDTVNLGFAKRSKLQTLVLAEALSELLLYPITHEEGHRSILTAEGIGSTSAPFFDLSGVAYVNGVTDATLQHLRDTKFPTYIRLHTAGNESDYMLALRSNALMTWDKETNGVLLIDYLFRKVSVTFYHIFSYEISFREPHISNELERDIVGHDVLSAIRHLHRPDMEFTRFTNPDDLTDEEKAFHKRVRNRALINMIDPMIFLKRGFTLKSGAKLNFAGGYAMAPFGDFIDEHFWLASGKLNAHFYLREFENRSTWFPAAGAEFANIPLANRWIADVGLHGWQQPQNLDFNTTQGQWGGAIDAMLKYRFFTSGKNGMGLSLNLGVTAKTQGFLPEEVAMGSHIGGRLGVSIWLK